jgi:hypothetical protein
MKSVLVALFILHGLIHLTGFFQQLNGRLLYPAVLWLVIALLLFCSGIMIAISKPIWWMVAIPAIVASQVLITIYWHSAKWGTLLNVVLIFASVVSVAQWNFNRKFNIEAGALLSPARVNKNKIITREMVEALPLPVSKWLSASGVIDKEMVHTVRLKQRGFMKMDKRKDQWAAISSEQYFNVDEPSFIWKVRMKMMNLLPISGRDESRNGHGRMQIKLLSLVNLVNDSDEKIDQGSLQRWLAEICWFPQAALMPYIHWEMINDHAARARLNWKGVEAIVNFYFNEDGRLIRCLADRYKGGGKLAVQEKWEIICKGHRLMDGVTIPTRAEVTWKLKTGDFDWFNLEIASIEYNRHQVYNEGN